ncbi:MAG: hypothetical protein PHG96_11640, partial [Kiritimatiellae bacterium]|nr:hypothetical protein [Kiritimatiellia bacterium]
MSSRLCLLTSASSLPDVASSSATEVINTAFTANPYFLGRPVEFVSQMNRVKAAADHVPLLYGNLRQGCVLGDARQFEIATDSSVLFTSDSI